MSTRAPAPLQLALPGGITADYVAGSDPPSYTVAREPIAVDVRIPDDLQATGWHWNGSFLVQPYPERPDGPATWISTGTWGVGGTWEQARTIDRLHAEHATARAARPVKPPKKPKKPKKRQQPAAPVQLAMEL